MAALTSPSIENNPAYEEAMDDVHTRFILNLPDEELQSAPRIFFQLEQAWWFYDDFICDGAAAAAAAEAGGATVEPLPRFKHVKPFSYAMFQFSPLLQPMLPSFEPMYAEFNKYKRSISTYGTILLNSNATKVALCRTWKGKSWTLPGGKVNQNESGKDAAARETYEETGFDPECERGVCGVWMERRIRGEVIEELDEETAGGGPDSDGADQNLLLPWSPLQDNDKVVYTENDTQKRRTCYVCRGVPESFPFEPVARKEVSEVKWHALNELPKHTYAVLPFVAQLRKWIKRDNRRRGIDNRSRGKSRGQSSRAGSRGKGGMATPSRVLKKGKARDEDDEDDIVLTPFFSDEGNAPWEGENESSPAVEVEDHEEEVGKHKGGSGKHSTKKDKKHKKQRDNSKKKSRPNSRPNSRAGSRGRQVTASDPLVLSALASPGEPDRWTEDEMFATNEQLLGRKITYDGNPHDFAEKGFDVAGPEGGGRVDPHSFRVVGGAFMNSDAATGAAAAQPPPEASMLQPLMNTRQQQRSRSGSKWSNVSALSNSDAGGDDIVVGGDNDGSDDEDGLGLTPFFSDDGKAPWEPADDAVGSSVGEGGGKEQNKEHITPPPVRSAAAAPGQKSNSKGLALLNRLRQGGSAKEEAAYQAEEQIRKEKGGSNSNAKKDKKKKKSKEKKKDVGAQAVTDDSNALDDWFMTDREITAKSQREKLSILPPLSDASQQVMPPAAAEEAPHPPPSAPPLAQVVDDDGSSHPGEHLMWMKQWVQQLPHAGPTKEFGDFRLDANLIMNSMMIATTASTAPRL